MASLHDLVPKYLRTTRLTLELFNHSPEHYQCLLEGMNSRTAHERMGDFGVRAPAQFDEMNAICRLRGQKFKDGIADDDLYYAIRLGPDAMSGGLIGGVSFCQRVAGATILPPDIGWVICEEHMGLGYATEAATELLRWGMQDFGLDEVVVFPSDTNQQSNRVAEKLGFVDGGKIADLDNPGKFMNILMLPGMKKITVREGFSIKQASS